MRKLALLCTALCATALSISASPVQAQLALWVANNGSDGNACSQTSPCATFQGAINKGNVGQVNCLTSGSYGPFTVTASITIDCGTGNIGTVFASGNTPAIAVNTGAGANVVLRHLSLNGFGLGALGINASSFASGTLIVEDCSIHGFGTGTGIYFAPSSGRGLLQLTNSQVFGNINGLYVFPAAGQIASVTLNRVELVANSSTGLFLGGPGIVAGTMRDSVAGGNGSTGVYAQASQVYFTVEQSSIVANLITGVQTGSGGAVVNVGGSTIGGNGTGVAASAGSLISFGNNQMSANGTNGSFSSTALLR